MKKLVMLGCMGLMFAVSSVAIAAPQQERMRSCNKEAKEKALKGDERKAFMKGCLRKKTASAADGTKADPAADAARQLRSEKRSACNQGAEEKALKGTERKKFMRDCMKK